MATDRVQAQLNTAFEFFRGCEWLSLIDREAVQEKVGVGEPWTGRGYLLDANDLVGGLSWSEEESGFVGEYFSQP